MKKLITAIIMLLAGSAGVMANTVTLGSAAGPPGSEQTIEVGMSGRDAVVAMEVRVPLHGAANYIDGSARLTDRCPGFSMQAREVEGELRLYIYSPSVTAIGDTDGAVATFRLRLAEVSGSFPLDPAVVLSNASGVKVECDVRGGSLDVRAAQLDILTPKVDFGHVPIRSECHSSFFIANSGNEPMTVSGLASNSEVVSVSPSSGVIASGESMMFEVTFSPQMRGAHRSTIEVHSDAVNGKPYKRWPVVEIVADPFSVNELHLQHAEGTANSTATVTLTMNNMEPIVGAQIELNLPQGIDYVDGSVRLSDRAQGHAVSAVVTDRKLRIIAYSGANTPFAGEEGDLLKFDVALNCNSGWFWLNPSRVILSNVGLENMTSAVSGEYVVVLSPAISGGDTLDFGEQPLTGPIVAEYEISNNGQVNLDVTDVTFLAEGFKCTTPLPMTIPPGENSKLQVTCTTGTHGPFTTTMNIYSNDPTARMKQVAVSGRAYSPNSLYVTGQYDEADGYMLEVSLNNHAGISAVQFDIAVSDPAAVGNSINVSVTERTEGFTAMASKVAGGRYRVVLFNLSNMEIAGNAGVIARVVIPAVEKPETLNIVVENIVLSTPSGANYTSPDASVCIEIDSTVKVIVYPESVRLNKVSTEILLGSSETLTATLMPEDVTESGLTWSTADGSVATVSGDGKVFAAGLGETEVKVETANGLSAVCKVKVIPIMAESISLDRSEGELFVDGKVRLTAVVLPTNTTDPTVIWSSGDETVATVDNEGVVTARGVGDVTITASTVNGLTATINLTVNEIKITGIEDVLDKAESDAVYYDLNGFRIENPGTGIYIRRRDNTLSKVCIGSLPK